MFADLNRYTVRPTKSIGILYDRRDPLSQLVNRLTDTVTVFRGTTEKSKTTISNRSRKLFTLSSLYQATKKLLGKSDGATVSQDDERLATSFWMEVAHHMPDWGRAATGEVSPAELRRDCIHVHGVVLQALATVGFDLVRTRPDDWASVLPKLATIDWRRSNIDLWEGRALQHGRLSKSQASVLETAAVIAKAIGFDIHEDPQDTEVSLEYQSI